jgi:cystathionine beta-lyase/cystathionine gamma-synthase
MSTTFVQESVDKYLEKGFSYSRTNNPTVSMLEEKVATLEGGFGAICVGTGMAATASCINAFVKAGEHVVMTNCSYGGTNRIMREQFAPLGIETSFVDFSDNANVEAAIKPNTKLIFSESPTNPTLQIADIEGLSKIAKAHGILHVCDSTFATPYICKPIEHGADLTIQSMTKYYDGHNIGTGGALICSTEDLYNRAKLVQNMSGNITAPMTAFLQLQVFQLLAFVPFTATFGCKFCAIENADI